MPQFLFLPPKRKKKTTIKAKKHSTKAMFGYGIVLRKEKKNIKENDFLVFGFTMENRKEKYN